MKSLKKIMMLNVIKGVVTSERDLTQLILQSVKKKKKKHTAKNRNKSIDFLEIINKAKLIQTQGLERAWFQTK